MTAIPVIDLAHARASESNRKCIAAQIDRANREVGFLTVINHGIETDLLSDVLSVTHAFFDLPEPAKNAYIGDPASSRGYIAPRARALAGTRGVMTPGDLVELFAMGMPHVPDEPYFDISNSGNNFHPNIWPAEIPGMERIWTAYYQRVAALAREIMSLFAEALDLEPDFFEDKIDKPISNLFANCYPPITTEPLPGQLRVGEHTDYGTLTLLYQPDEVGGLEVQVNGSWFPVPAIAGAYVVNIGDLMARWTNDRWISTLHRVQNPPEETRHLRRLSLPFFCQPNYDAVIETLPSCVSAGNPAHYPPITSGENVRGKTDTSFAVAAST